MSEGEQMGPTTREQGVRKPKSTKASDVLGWMDSEGPVTVAPGRPQAAGERSDSVVLAAEAYAQKTAEGDGKGFEISELIRLKDWFYAGARWRDAHPGADVRGPQSHIMSVSKEWCMAAAQREADAGDPEVTAGSEATFKRAMTEARLCHFTKLPIVGRGQCYGCDYADVPIVRNTDGTHFCGGCRGTNISWQPSEPQASASVDVSQEAERIAKRAPMWGEGQIEYAIEALVTRAVQVEREAWANWRATVTAARERAAFKAGFYAAGCATDGEHLRRAYAAYKAQQKGNDA